MGLVDHAKAEFKALGWPGDEESQKWVCDDVIELLEVFAKQGHSGFSAPYVISLFSRLARFKPIGPLTGKDDEWSLCGPECGDVMYQNKRMCSVFKREDGTAYWSEGKIFEDENGVTYTSSDSRVDIEFPFTPRDPEFVKYVKPETSSE